MGGAIPEPMAPGRMTLTAEVLGLLMPMHLWVGPAGEIRGAGPTLAKLLGQPDPLGAPFCDHFDLCSGRAEQGAHTMALARMPGRRVHLTLRRDPATALRGSAVAIGERGADGVLLNLSFGVHLSEAVRKHGLTDADFAPSELAMELLYLQEAKAAVMGELLALNTRLEGARREAEAQALTDPLTGLANRRALDLALAEASRAAAQGGPLFALAHVDLDHFKAVNDTLGHAAGDHVLSRVADVLREQTRRGDLVARVGGDEFVLILRGFSEPAALQELGQRIIARLEVPCSFDGVACRVSGSIGVALSSSYTRPDPDQLLADADRALYASKRRGRARCTVLLPGAHLPEESRIA